MFVVNRLIVVDAVPNSCSQFNSIGYWQRKNVRWQVRLAHHNSPIGLGWLQFNLCILLGWGWHVKAELRLTAGLIPAGA